MLIKKINEDKRDIPIEDLLDYLSQIVISKIDETCCEIDNELSQKKEKYRRLKETYVELKQQSEEIIRQLSRIRRISEIIENVDKIMKNDKIDGSTKNDILSYLEGIENKEPSDIMVIEEKIKLSVNRE